MSLYAVILIFITEFVSSCKIAYSNRLGILLNKGNVNCGFKIDLIVVLRLI